MVVRTSVIVAAVGLAAACLGGGSAATAWGPDGHRVVCEIAWQEVGPAGKQMMLALMAGDSEDATFASACNWPDRIKSDSGTEWIDQQHYVNVPPGASFSAAEHCPVGGCVVRAIGQHARVLADPSAGTSARREALKFLGHYVGDIHQPLHVSYPQDHGGNNIKTRLCASECRNLKLHAVWDSGIIEDHEPDWNTLAVELRGTITPEQYATWKEQIDVDLWTDEAFELAEGHAYRQVSGGAVQPGYIGDLQQPVKLDESYATTMRPIIREQLQKAGVRLAKLLDQLASGQVPAAMLAAPALKVTPSDAVHNGLFVRAEPRNKAKKLTTLTSGQAAELLGEVVVHGAPDWYVVRLADGRPGYVRADYADVIP